MEMDKNAETLARGVLRRFASWRPQVSGDLAYCAVRVLDGGDEEALRRLVVWAMQPTSTTATKEMARAAERLRIVFEQRDALARRDRPANGVRERYELFEDPTAPSSGLASVPSDSAEYQQPDRRSDTPEGIQTRFQRSEAAGG
jgi:hypothetical protein